MLKLLWNDFRYRVICAFCTSKYTKDHYARLWLQAFESFRQTLPTPWHVSRSWKVKLLAAEAYTTAFLLKPVWKLRGY